MNTEVSSDSRSFFLKIDNLLNLPAGSVQGDQALRTLKNWDSLTILEFIVMADSDYRSNLQPSDIAACQTVDDLARLTFSDNNPS